MKNIFLYVVIVVLLGLGLWWALSIKVPTSIPTPTPSVSVSSTPTPATPAITITSPKDGDTVGSPITVTGTARVFENQFTVQVKDDSDKVVASAHVFTDATDAGQFGNYSVKIPIPAGTATNTMKVEALSYSAKGDGSFEGYASASVKLSSIATANVTVAFLPTPIGLSCEVTKLYQRKVTKTLEPAYVGLSELLKGPAPAEKVLGATTQIPDGVKINSVSRTGDTIYADFDQTLQEKVGGSCRGIAIRSQITNTLKQLSGVKSVVISINGQTVDILQP